MLNKKVAKRIKQERIEKSITQTELAEKTRISQAEISRIENSTTTITLPDIEKIASSLNVTIKALLDDSTE